MNNKQNFVLLLLYQYKNFSWVVGRKINLNYFYTGTRKWDSFKTVRSKKQWALWHNLIRCKGNYSSLVKHCKYNIIKTFLISNKIIRLKRQKQYIYDLFFYKQSLIRICCVGWVLAYSATNSKTIVAGNSKSPRLWSLVQPGHHSDKKEVTNRLFF